jgi:hypothetical protein
MSYFPGAFITEEMYCLAVMETTSQPTQPYGLVIQLLGIHLKEMKTDVYLSLACEHM